MFKKVRPDQTFKSNETQEQPAVPVIDYSAGKPQKLDMSTLTGTAVGTFKDSKGNWMVAVIKFNSETDQAAIEKVLDEGPDQGMAMERFKILAANLELV